MLEYKDWGWRQDDLLGADILSSQIIHHLYIQLMLSWAPCNAFVAQTTIWDLARLRMPESIPIKGTIYWHCV